MTHNRCIFCGENADEPDHYGHCDGKQGTIDAQEPEPVLLARRSDPETSHEAMARFDRETMRSAMDCIVTVHRERGPMPDFEEKVAFAAAWGRPCCDHLYQQARSAARDKGWIVDTGERCINPTTNRRQVVWAAATGPALVITKCAACGHVLRRKAS